MVYMRTFSGYTKHMQTHHDILPSRSLTIHKVRLDIVKFRWRYVFFRSRSPRIKGLAFCNTSIREVSPPRSDSAPNNDQQDNGEHEDEAKEVVGTTLVGHGAIILITARHWLERFIGGVRCRWWLGNCGCRC